MKGMCILIVFECCPCPIRFALEREGTYPGLFLLDNRANLTCSFVSTCSHTVAVEGMC